MVDPTFSPQNDRYICFYDDSDEEEEDGSNQYEDNEDGGGRGNGGDVPRAAKYVTGEVSPLCGSPTGFKRRLHIQFV